MTRHPRFRTPLVSSLRVAAVAAVLALAAPASQGQTYTWTHPGTTATAANWSAGPWSPSVPPANSTSTILQFNAFSGNGAFTFTNDIGAFTANGLELNNSSASAMTFDLGASAFTLGGTNPFLTNGGAGNVTLSGAGGMTLSSGTVVNGGGGGVLTLSRVLSGAGGLNVNQTGLGVFSLTGANTAWGGGVTVTNGVLGIGNAAALGTAPLTVNGGGLRFTSGVTVANNVAANTDLVFSGLTTGTLSGVISGPGGLRLENFNTAAGVTLQGANTYTGATTLQSFLPQSTQAGPTLTLSGANGSIASTQPITVGKNATLQLIEANGATNANRVADAAPITLHGGRIAYNGVDGSTETFGDLTVTGGGQIIANPTLGISILNFGTLTRQDNATLTVSNGIGSLLAGSGAIHTRVFFSGGVPTLAAGSGTGTETGVVPWMVGYGLAGGSATNPRAMVTYGAGGGLQVIGHDDAAFVVQVAGPAAFTTALGNGSMANKNVHLSGAGTYDLAGGTLQINALTTSASTVLLQNGTLRNFSGFISGWDAISFGDNLTLDFQNRTGYFHGSWNQLVTGTAQITGSGGLVIGAQGGAAAASSTGNVVFQNTTGNPFTGGLTVNGNVSLGFRQDNQLGAAGEPILLGGGRLGYNAAANLEITRPITLGPSGGGFSFNATNSNASTTAGNAVAGTVLTVSGVISGPGGLTKDGVGTLNLTGTNTYAGGTIVNLGTLQFTTQANLGTGPLTLNGGTLQPLAAATHSMPIQVNIASTLLTNVDTTLAGAITSVGQLHGTAGAGLTKTGNGTLTLTGASPNFVGSLTVSAGNLTIGGANGALTGAQNITANASRVFTVDDTAAANPNRLGNTTTVTLVTSGTFNYLANSAGSTETIGRLAVTGTGSIVDINANSAVGPTSITFNSLSVPSGASVLLRGTDLGGTSANATHIFLGTLQGVTLSGALQGVNYSNTSGGASQGAAGYDSVLGVIPFTTVSVSGNVIDNFAPTSTPKSALFTTTGDTTANTGAVVHTLTLDVGTGVNLVDGANPPSSTNNFIPTGTLGIGGGTLVSQNGPKTISRTVGTTSPTVAFGPVLANITTTSDLTFGTGVAVSGTGGLTKTGAGTLTFQGPVNVIGTATLNGGGVIFNNGVNSTFGGLVGAAPITITGAGSRLTLTAGGTATGTITAETGSAGLTFAPTAAGTLSVGLTLNNTALTIGGVSPTVNSVITGTGGITTTPTAATVVTLGGNNTGLSGAVVGNTFTSFTITNANAFGTGAVTVNNDTATLTFNHATATVPNNFILSNPAAAATRTISASTTAGRTITLGGVISGGGANGTLNFTGTGTTTGTVLANAGNTFRSNINLVSGFLQPGSNAALGNAANTIALSGGTLRFDNTQTFARNMTANAGGIEVTGTNTVDLTGSLTSLGVGSTFTKTGTGTLRFGVGPSNFDQGVNVNAGRLLVTNGLAGSFIVDVISVNSGGTFGGTGNLGTPGSGLNRNVTVNSGGTFAPGNPDAAWNTSPGDITLEGPMTTAAGSTIRVRVTGGAPAALNSGGSSGGGAFNGRIINPSFDTMTFNAATTIFIDAPSTPFVAGQNYSYLIANATGFGGITGTPTLFQFSGGYGITNFSITNTGTQLFVNFTPVPEPGTVLGVAAVGLGLAAGLRRRLVARRAA